MKGKHIVAFYLFFLTACATLSQRQIADKKFQKLIRKVNDKYQFMQCENLIIKDGDTIALNNGEVVRYLSINAPELGERGGVEARWRNVELLKNKTCQLFLLRFDADTLAQCYYGRNLGYVYVLNNGKYVNVNRLLVEEGLADCTEKFDKRLPLYVPAQ